MKNFFASKINWAGFAVLIIALQDIIANWGDKPVDFKTVATAVLGFAIIIIRTFFTSKPIAKKAG